jgi:hypothetical protein
VSARFGEARTWGTTEIIVDGEDVLGLTVPMQADLTVSGRVVYPGNAPRTGRAQVDLPLTLTMAGPQDVPPSVRIDGDRSFKVEGLVPGMYRLGPQAALHAPLGRLWLKSIVVNGRDLLDAPIELRQSADDAVVTLSDRASDVTGAVMDRRGVVLPGQTVILFAADRRSWFFHSRRIAAGRTNAQGRYQIRNLPPGEYYAVATADLDEGEWVDPVVLDQLARGATPIRVEEDERKDLNLVGR